MTMAPDTGHDRFALHAPRIALAARARARDVSALSDERRRSIRRSSRSARSRRRTSSRRSAFTCRKSETRAARGARAARTLREADLRLLARRRSTRRSSSSRRSCARSRRGRLGGEAQRGGGRDAARRWRADSRSRRRRRAYLAQRRRTPRAAGCGASRVRAVAARRGRGVGRARRRAGRGARAPRRAKSGTCSRTACSRSARLLAPRAAAASGSEFVGGATALYLKLLAALLPSDDRPRSAPRRSCAARSCARRWTRTYMVRAGEKIVGAHEVVGRAEYDKLRALHDAMQSTVGGDRALPARARRHRLQRARARDLRHRDPGVPPGALSTRCARSRSSLRCSRSCSWWRRSARSGSPCARSSFRSRSPR